MSKTRWALLLLLSIGALLAFLLVLLPRRPAPRAGEYVVPVPEKEPLPLVVPLAEPLTEPQAESRVAARALPEPREVRLAIVIDDVGYNLSGLKAFLALPYPLAFSVLPDLPHSREAGRLIAAAGKELLVHLPMEPSSGSNPGPGAVLTAQSDEEIQGLSSQSLERLPQAVGLNNHMGSRATADRRVMGVVLGFLRGRGLFFLDSRTTADTVRPGAGRAIGRAPAGARRVPGQRELRRVYRGGPASRGAHRAGPGQRRADRARAERGAGR